MLLNEIERMAGTAGAGDKVRRGLAVLSSFVGALKLTFGDVTLGVDIAPETGTADSLGVKVTSLGPVRAKLIRKGMIYSPAHGEMAFAVPLFDDFMVRSMPEFGP